MGDRAEGDSRPGWLSSREGFRLSRAPLVGGGVGHLSRLLVVWDMYRLPARTHTHTQRERERERGGEEGRERDFPS